MILLKDWHEAAIKMHEDGMSSRQISTILGKGKSTINDMLVKWYKDKPKEVVEKKSNTDYHILFLDIETMFIQTAGWGLFNQNYSVDQILEDWSLLSFCAKRSDSDEIVYMASDEYTEIEMLQKLWELLDQAPYVCAHNGRKFDVRKIFSRMILNGLDRPSPFRQIDTLEVVKRNFSFTSNKLVYLTENLCKNNVKLSHSKFPGIALWLECAKGNPEAYQELKLYNIADVLSLAELYETLSQWDTKLPVFEVHTDEVVDMSDWEPCGFVYSNLGKYDCFRNKKSKQYRRGRVNLLSKEKRASLLANIV